MRVQQVEMLRKKSLKQIRGIALLLVLEMYLGLQCLLRSKAQQPCK